MNENIEKVENTFNKSDSQGIFIFNKCNLHLELKKKSCFYPNTHKNTRLTEFYRQYSKKQKSL